MIDTLLRKYRTLRRIGLFRYLRMVVDRIFLSGLVMIYGFDSWHAQAPTSARPYRHVVAHLTNELAPRTVVEVGCGLGGILALVSAPDRYGYDIDERAIRAARFLHGRRIIFTCGGITAVSLAQIDVLILVNWIHELSPDALKQLLTLMLARSRYLLLDAIDRDGPDSYRYKHDFAFLGTAARLISVTRAPGECRSFHLFEVIS
ncbi:MAG: class I SAM-dependent methyltransferase [Gammaproteobacteria bacterium]